MDRDLPIGPPPPFVARELTRVEASGLTDDLGAMVRFAIALSALLLGACSREADAPAAPVNEGAPVVAAAAGSSTFAGAGRDRLCLKADKQAAFITYGEGDANCSVQGQVEGEGERMTLVPNGDATCRIDMTRSGDIMRLGSVTQACAYYCGPKASFEGKTFTRTDKAVPVTDLAGEPLC